MWLLGPWALGPGHNVSDLLLMDQQMARQLGTTLRPAGRLLLPLAAAPGPDQVASLRLWVMETTLRLLGLMHCNASSSETSWLQAAGRTRSRGTG